MYNNDTHKAYEKIGTLFKFNGPRISLQDIGDLHDLLMPVVKQMIV